MQICCLFLQLTDKLDGILSALSGTADQISFAEAPSIYPDKLIQEIEETRGWQEDLDTKSAALEAVTQAASELISQAAASKDPAHKGA